MGHVTGLEETVELIFSSSTLHMMPLITIMPQGGSSAGVECREATLTLVHSEARLAMSKSLFSTVT